MQDDLFGARPTPPPTRPKPAAVAPDPEDNNQATLAPPRGRSTEVLPLPPNDTTRALAARLNPRIRLGASTGSYPGWAGIVWDEGSYIEAVLTKNCLSAYAQHPQLRCVGIDRSFYRPMTEAQYARSAGQAADQSAL